MIADWKARVEHATVRFLRFGGQGVIVPGNLIVTAAHVIQWDGSGPMTLGDHFIEDVEVAGRKLKAEVYAVEPVSDLAVLGCPDNQAFIDESGAFKAAVEAVPPIPICVEDFPRMTSFRAHILTHHGRWVDGRATQYGVGVWPTMTIEASEGIEGGTSGGPVITTDGLLLGVVSIAGGASGGPLRTVGIPRLSLATPAWLLRRMVDTS